MSFLETIKAKSKLSFNSSETADEIISRYTSNLFRHRIVKPSGDSFTPNFKLEEGGQLIYDVRAKIQVRTSSIIQSSSSEVPVPNLNSPETSKLKDLRHSGPVPDFSWDYTIEIPESYLLFDSKFESGNLKKVIRATESEYLLYLNTDTNTDSHNHWYYFSVNSPIKQTVTFKICNLRKFDFLYTVGMKPVVFSEKDKNLGWHRDGESIQFKKQTKYFQLSFDYSFKHQKDIVYFAYAIPYTYKDLSGLTESLRTCSHIARVDTLCKTVGGNDCEMITITEDIETFMPIEEEQKLWTISTSGRRILRQRKIRRGIKKEYPDHNSKKGIVITARVHPGESVSSYVMHGVLNFLTGQSRIAGLLRQKFVFRIVPMLNPDGVRFGNYRSSLVGVDLNRKWKNPDKSLHPTIFFTKKMMEVFKESYEILMYCDLHGHTRMRNVFMYGCSYRSYEPLLMKKALLAKVIPVLFAQKTSIFRFKQCHFKVHRSKEGTGRVVVYNDLGITHSYTMETSFYGVSCPKYLGSNNKNDCHLSAQHLMDLGKQLCELCLTFGSPGVYIQRIMHVNNYLHSLIHNRTTGNKAKEEETNQGIFKNERKMNIEFEDKNILEDEEWGNIEIADYSSSEEDFGSDSDESEDEVPLPVAKNKTKDLPKSPMIIKTESPPAIKQTPKSSLKHNIRIEIETPNREKSASITWEKVNLNNLNMIDFFKKKSRDFRYPTVKPGHLRTATKDEYPKIRSTSPHNNVILPLVNKIKKRLDIDVTDNSVMFNHFQDTPIDLIFGRTNPKELAKTVANHKRYAIHRGSCSSRPYNI